MFDQFLKKQDQSEFTKEDYLKYVDGKPRYEGVKSFLESRKIKLPFGYPKDSPDKQTVCGLGNRKNELYQKTIKKEKPHVFQSSVDLIKEMKKRGARIGLASSSKNTKLILKITGLTKLFDTIVDGVVSADLGLKGKPEGDIFVKACENMNIRPSRSIVFEDALSGVQAGKNGNFGLVVGVKRGSQKLSPADIVVKDLKDISIKKIENWFEKGIEKNAWSIDYYNYNPETEGIREAISTVGNGFIATRGCHATEKDGPEEHYPGVYLAGIYNKPPSDVHGKNIYNNDLVNNPNWLLTEIEIEGDKLDPLNPDDCEIIDYHQSLNMKDAVLSQDITIRDRKKRDTRISVKRFSSMDNMHLACQKIEVTPLNYDAKIKISSFIDSDVKNNNVARYRQLKTRHLKTIARKKIKEALFLHAKTTYSKHDIIYHARHNYSENGKPKKTPKKLVLRKGAIGEELTIKAKQNNIYSLEKLVSIHTSRESKEPKKQGLLTIKQAKDFSSCLVMHKVSWSSIWKKADIEIKGDIYSQKVIRLHIYHLLSTASPHSQNIDSGIPARGLHGEGYRGHIFWDELYIIPFFVTHFPEIARSHLMYRYRRLPGAERYANSSGYEGAMFPWQTADTGEEETQEIHYNPNNDSWGPDLSRNQRHVSIAIFFDFWLYYHITGDEDFTKEFSAEVMMEIARFWTSITEYDKKDKKYHIRGVMGPDEFHEKPPRSKKAGFTDNAYTNVMVSWLLKRASEIAEIAKDEMQTPYEEIKKWNEISNNLKVNCKNSIVEQFDKFFSLKELDWKAYRKKYGNIERLDRILKAEGKSPDSYKAIKQADFLMLYYNLPVNTVTDILRNLGVNIKDPVSFMKKNYSFYEKRTSHGSTLSKIVHGIISSYMNKEKESRMFFDESLRSDISERERLSTKEGIHTGVMAGTIDFIYRRFAGLNYREDILKLNPKMPKEWKCISFRMLHRGIWYDITISQDKIEARSSKRSKIKIKNKEIRLSPGKTRKVIY